ncbi:MAG: type II toxin-antitoxin system HicA family toxin [Candidatus Rifleibacteriota bacterium]
MIKTPRLTGKKLISALKKLGFIQTRKKGSHCFFKHPDGRCTVVPVHSGEIIGVGLLCSILSDCEIDDDSLAQLLKK